MCGLFDTFCFILKGHIDEYPILRVPSSKKTFGRSIFGPLWIMLLINLRTVNWLQCTHVLLFLKYNMLCGQRSPLRDTQHMRVWYLSHIAKVICPNLQSNLVNLKSKALEILFRIIENSNYREVDIRIYTPHPKWSLSMLFLSISGRRFFYAHKTCVFIDRVYKSS